MLEGIRLREAEPADAEAISTTLIASITQLCSADHGDNPEVIAAWTANKTPDQIVRWISPEDSLMLVADHVGATIAGVGPFTLDGRILLNYVHPDYRNQGISRQILNEMEQRLVARGKKRATLTATTTALRFYQSAGWVTVGPAADDFGFPGFPMEKNLG